MTDRQGSPLGDDVPFDETPAADAHRAAHRAETTHPSDPALEDPDLDLLAALYATGSIEGEELTAFQARLVTDPVARARVAALQEAVAGVGGLRRVEPAPHLKDAVMARLLTTPQLTAEATDVDGSRAAQAHGSTGGSVLGSAERPEPPLATVTPLRRRDGASSRRAGRAAALPGQNRRRPLVALLAAAAAAVLVLGVGTLGWTTLQDRRQEQAVQTAVSQVVDAPDAVTIAAASDSTPGWNAAHVVYSPSEGRVAVVDTDGVPPLDGRDYQLWFVDAEGQHPAGIITESSVGAVLQGDMTGAASVAVTVEPLGGSTRPSGNPVAVFEMNEA